MPSTVQTLTKKGIAHPPQWMPANVHYEVITGSVAYGVSSDTSDMDVYGFCIPPKQMIWPHLAGEIPGFGSRLKRFDNYEEHHLQDASAMGGKGREYDLSIYSIVRFFQLCMDNNANMLDTLFVPEECILHITHVGDLVRQNRKLFVHKGCWWKFRGYARAQMHKMRTKNPEEGGNRAALVEKYGYDTKFAYNLYRLLDEVEQLLTTGEMDIRRAKETLKAVRRGEIPEEEVYAYYERMEPRLQKAYDNSKIPERADEKSIKAILLQCLEHHFGSLDKCLGTAEVNQQLVTEVQQVLDKWRN